MAKRLRNESDFTSNGSNRPRKAEDVVEAWERVTELFNAEDSLPIPWPHHLHYLHW